MTQNRRNHNRMRHYPGRLVMYVPNNSKLAIGQGPQVAVGYTHQSLMPASAVNKQGNVDRHFASRYSARGKHCLETSNGEHTNETNRTTLSLQPGVNSIDQGNQSTEDEN